MRLADSKLNGKSGKLLYLTACAGGKHSCSSTLKVMLKKRMKANPTRTEKVNEEKQDQVWTARSRCPTRLEDTTSSVTCCCETFIFSALSNALQCPSHLMSCDHFQHSTVIIPRSSLSCCAISPVPDIPGNPGSCKCPRQAGLLQHQQDPDTYLQLQLPHQPVSFMLCPMLRAPCTRQCAASFCHAFSIVIHFYFKPPRKLRGKKFRLLQFSYKSFSSVCLLLCKAFAK